MLAHGSHPDVKMLAHEIPDMKCRRTEFLPGWNELCRKGDRLRVQGVGTPLSDDTEHARVSGSTPSGFPKRTCAAMLSSTREHHTPDDSISYPDMLSGSLTKVSKPCYSPRSAAILSERVPGKSRICASTEKLSERVPKNGRIRVSTEK